MTTAKFVIDGTQTVHTTYCQAVGEKALPYVTAPKDYIEMGAWLKRDEFKDGRTSGSTFLSPCALCIPSDS